MGSRVIRKIAIVYAKNDIFHAASCIGNLISKFRITKLACTSNNFSFKYEFLQNDWSKLNAHAHSYYTLHFVLEV